MRKKTAPKALPKNRNITQNTINWYLDVGYHYATLQRSQLAKILKVPPQLVARWLNGTAEAHPHTLELIRLHAFGDPPCGFGEEWKGWRFARGQLIDSNRDDFYAPADIAGAPYIKKMFHQGLNDQRRLERTIDALQAELAAYKQMKNPPLRLVYSR